MNTTYRILPVYTGDVSGVCSALFELGGMVVIHDPSGCNSTYNTHDETRWYDHDSLIFISGLSEIDAVMGNDEKLIADTVDAAIELRPKFITLVNSPIPFLNGTDFAAISRIIESRTGIPTFYIPTNGMHDYIPGAGEAFAEIARRFVSPREHFFPNSVNILGVTPLDFGAEGSAEALRAMVQDGGFTVNSCWAMGDDLANISCSASAAANLVVSATGYRAAQMLRARFGTPYVIGCPIGDFSQKVFSALRDAMQSGENQFPLRNRPRTAHPAIYAVGEPVTMGSLLAALDVPARLLCPLEQCEDLLYADDTLIVGEEEAQAMLEDANVVIADPMYRPVLSTGTKLIELPHEAFSGRCYRRSMKNLFTLDISSLRKEANL